MLSKIIEKPIPLVSEMKQNYPNPFNPITTINYSVAKEAMVRLVIYNSKGQQIIQLVNETNAIGYYNIPWNGKDFRGKPVPSGMYYYKINIGKKYSKIRTMTMIK